LKAARAGRGNDRPADRILGAQPVPGVCWWPGGAGGWWSLQSIPMDAIPDLSDTQVIVYSKWTSPTSSKTRKLSGGERHLGRRA